MKIVVVGLGYVGTVSAACFAVAGHTVCGVDVNSKKVQLINEGRTPVVEPGLGELITEARAQNRLTATNDLSLALADADLCFVAVATPSFPNGNIDTRHLLRACEQIASAFPGCREALPVIIRSSILPSVLDECSQILDCTRSGRTHLCINPEFLREGTAIDDFNNPSFTLLGVEDSSVERKLRVLYQHIAAPVIVMSPRAALLVKYASNAFHAVKAVFANEMGFLCREVGINADDVMNTFCKDTKLNISARYLKPGFAFGGSCLPKDVRALLYAAKKCDLDLPLLSSLLPSNESVIRRTVHDIHSTGCRRIGLVGLAFKANTDDLRESPFVEVAERLLGKGCKLKIYDPNVSVSRLTGANKEYIERVLPHLSELLVGAPSELAGCELLLIAHNYLAVGDVLRELGIPTVHLVTGAMPMFDGEDISGPELPAPGLAAV